MFQNINKSDLINSIIKDVFTTDKYSSNVVDPGEESEYIYVLDDEGIPDESIEALNGVMRQNIVLHTGTKDGKIVGLEEKSRCFILIDGADFDGVRANAVKKNAVIKNKYLDEAQVVYMIFPKVFKACVRYFEAKTDFSVRSDLEANIYETDEYIERVTHATKLNRHDVLFSDGANVGSEIWIHGFETTIGYIDWVNEYIKFTRLVKVLVSLLIQRDEDYGTEDYYELMKLLGIELLDAEGEELDEAEFDDEFENFMRIQFHKVQLMKEV